MDDATVHNAANILAEAVTELENARATLDTIERIAQNVDMVVPDADLLALVQRVQADTGEAEMLITQAAGDLSWT